MPQRPPVEKRTVRYWRDERIDRGCVSDRTEIAAPAAPETAITDEADAFGDRLLEAGFSFEQSEVAAKIFDEFLTGLRARLATDAVREILLSIATTKTGKTPEFRAILKIFSPGRTLEDVAEEARLSKQSVNYHEQKLAPIFDTAPAYVEQGEVAKKNEQPIRKTEASHRTAQSRARRNRRGKAASDGGPSTHT